MQIKLNKISFTVAEVSGQTRSALLTDRDVGAGVVRAVWSWDAETGEAAAMAGLKSDLQVPNGLAFFVSRPGDGPKPVRNDGATEKMRDRFVEAVGAKSHADLVAAINRVLGIPQLKMPYEQFDKLKPVATYRLLSHADYAVAELREASRNLTAYLLIPGQVAFRAEITKVIDEAGLEALFAAEPELKTRIPAFILAARSKPALDIRRVALIRRVGEVQAMVKHFEDAGRSDDELRMPRMELQRLAAEARVLAPKPDEKLPAANSN